MTRRRQLACAHAISTPSVAPTSMVSTPRSVGNAVQAAATSSGSVRGRQLLPMRPSVFVFQGRQRVPFPFSSTVDVCCTRSCSPACRVVGFPPGQVAGSRCSHRPSLSGPSDVLHQAAAGEVATPASPPRRLVKSLIIAVRRLKHGRSRGSFASSAPYARTAPILFCGRGKPASCASSQTMALTFLLPIKAPTPRPRAARREARRRCPIAMPDAEPEILAHRDRTQREADFLP